MRGIKNKRQIIVRLLQITIVIAVILLARSISFSWLTNPSDAFSVSAEIDFDVGFFVSTVVALVFVIAEYAADHLDWAWGKVRKRLFAVGVIVGFSGELLFEMGSFWYSYVLQTSQAETIKELGRIAEGAKSDAKDASSTAGTALAEAIPAQIEAQIATNQTGDLTNKERSLRDALGKGLEAINRANNQLAALETEQAQLEKASIPPFVDAEFLGTQLQRFSGAEIDVVDTGDATIFSEISTGISDAKLTSRPVSPANVAVMSGIHVVYFEDKPRSPEIAKALCTFLVKSGLTVETDALMEGNDARIAHSWNPAVDRSAVLVLVGYPTAVRDFLSQKEMRAHGHPNFSIPPSHCD